MAVFSGFGTTECHLLVELTAGLSCNISYLALLVHRFKCIHQALVS